MKPSEQAMGRAIANMVESLWVYSMAYEQEFSQPDGVLGEGVLSILHGLNELLNGPLGLQDGGTLSRQLYALATRANLTDENGEF